VTRSSIGSVGGGEQGTSRHSSRRAASRSAALAGWGWCVVLRIHPPLGRCVQLDLTCQHKNQTLLVEGPEVMIRPVGARPQRGLCKTP
jgi:hypothetical protein